MGKIILLNTPIGNLGDLTPRVLEALKSGHLFAAEDTRVFKDLLGHLGISIAGKKILSLHDQSEGTQVIRLLELARHEDLYVTSDAGSPVISDPAYPLITAALKEGFKLESFSGVSSPVMALELSGLPPMPFHFHGFLPREKGKKNKAFDSLNHGTNIFFEAPTRIEETMDLLQDEYADFQVVLVRELSKKFEQVVRLKAGEWATVKKEVMMKGEFVLLIHQPQESRASTTGLTQLAQEILAKGPAPKALAKLLAEILDRPTKEIYTELMQKK